MASQSGSWTYDRRYEGHAWQVYRSVPFDSKSPLDVVAGWTIETAGARLETSIGTFGDGDCELDIYLFNGKKVHIDFYAKDFSSDPGFR